MHDIQCSGCEDLGGCPGDCEGSAQYDDIDLIQWHHDPAHSWLRVPLTMLAGFTPSQYSYFDDKFAYLEEDCDAGGWAKHGGYLWIAKNCPQKYTDGESPIRAKRQFSA